MVSHEDTTSYASIYQQLYELGAWFVLLNGGNRTEKRSKAPSQKWRDRRPEWLEVKNHQGVFDSGLPALGIIPASLDMLVVDADAPGDGVSWKRVQREVESILGPVLSSLKTDGKNKGLHLYYRSPDPAPENRKWEIEDVCSGEIRGANGYVILWDPAAALQAASIASTRSPAPESELPSPASKGRGLKAISGVKSGSRNETLNAEYFRLLASGEHDPEAITEAVHIAALKTGLPVSEIEDTMARVRKDAEKKARPRFPKNPDGLAKAFNYLDLTLRYNVRADVEEILRDGKWEGIPKRAEEELRWLVNRKCDGMSSGSKRVPLHFGREMWDYGWNVYMKRHEVDTFKDWLEDLPKWDGQVRLRSWIRDAFSFAEDAQEELIDWAGAFMFLGAVQRTMEPGCTMDEMPVFIGPQGCGKSLLLREMFPAQGRDEWMSDRFPFDGSAKEKVEALLGRVVVECSEMAGIKVADIEDLKSFISSKNDGAIRLAYDRRPMVRSRRCIFIGTANGASLPNDPTGNRRFVAIPLAGRGKHPSDLMAELREKLWAEALVRYKEGWRANLPDELKTHQEEVNEGYRQADETIEALISARVDEFEGKTMAEIKDVFGPVSHYSDHRVGRALRFNGMAVKRVKIKGTSKCRREWHFIKTS